MDKEDIISLQQMDKTIRSWSNARIQDQIKSIREVENPTRMQKIVVKSLVTEINIRYHSQREDNLIVFMGNIDRKEAEIKYKYKRKLQIRKAKRTFDSVQKGIRKEQRLLKYDTDEELEIKKLKAKLASERKKKYDTQYYKDNKDAINVKRRRKYTPLSLGRVSDKQRREIESILGKPIDS